MTFQLHHHPQSIGMIETSFERGALQLLNLTGESAKEVPRFFDRFFWIPAQREGRRGKMRSHGCLLVQLHFHHNDAFEPVPAKRGRAFLIEDARHKRQARGALFPSRRRTPQRATRSSAFPQKRNKLSTQPFPYPCPKSAASAEERLQAAHVDCESSSVELSLSLDSQRLARCFVACGHRSKTRRALAFRWLRCIGLHAEHNPTIR